MLVPGSTNPLLLFPSAAAGGYQISRSLRFNSADSPYLSRTFATPTSNTVWTLSAWVKRSQLGAAAQTILSAGTSEINFQSDLIYFYAAGPSTAAQSTAVFRDPSAWYHLVVASNGTTVVGYINNSQVMSYTGTLPQFNSASTHTIGKFANSSVDYFNGYLADIHFIDGQALTPSSFTEVSATTGQLIPKAYTGSFGTNGFHLDFADNSAATAAALGKDTSGNGNNWTPNNLSVTAGAGNDSLVDVPTNGSEVDTGAGGEVRGNYATLNPLVGGTNFSQITLSNGNLDAVWAGTTNYATVLGTIGASSGKWYWEVTAVAAAAIIGVAKDPVDLANYVGAQSGSYSYYSATGNTYNNTTATAYGNTYTAGDVIGIALDLDNGKVFFSKNGTWQNSGSPTGGTGAAFTGLSGTFYPALSDGTSTATSSYSCNFGQRPFAYTAPSGYKALCTANLPAPVVTKPSTVMDVVLYTGTGSTLTPTSSLGFSPDLVWIKGRSGATDHALYDTVRGAQARLESNTTDAEVTTDGGVTAFNSNGFTLGTLAQVNTNTATYAAWCWDAGSSNVVNTQGSITSTVRANPSAGFSIVTYTASGVAGTVGHGLNVTPGMIIAKSRNNTSGVTGWAVYHSSLGSGSTYMILNLTDPAASSAGYWGTPNSSTFGVAGTLGFFNNNGSMVAYCFAPVAGYSSFGVITSNGTSDNAFAYLGFRPRFILYKNASATGNWGMYDSARDPENVCDNLLLASASNAEFTSVEFDFLSNGIKLRYPYTNGNQIVYAAFAESPFAANNRAR